MKLCYKYSSNKSLFYDTSIFTINEKLATNIRSTNFIFSSKHTNLTPFFTRYLIAYECDTLGLIDIFTDTIIKKYTKKMQLTPNGEKYLLSAMKDTKSTTHLYKIQPSIH